MAGTEFFLEVLHKASPSQAIYTGEREADEEEKFQKLVKEFNKQTNTWLFGR